MTQNLEGFDSVYGQAEGVLEESVPCALLPFIFYLHVRDGKCLRLQITDFHSNSWQTVRTIEQLEDLRDQVGIGGSWDDFIKYIREAFLSENVKLILGGPASSIGGHGATSARVIAQKCKGMPRVSISLEKISGPSDEDAMGNIAVALLKAFKYQSDVLGTEQKNASQLIESLALEKVAASPSLDYSHFISLPLSLHPALVEQVVRFQDSVLAPKKDCAIDKSIFVKPTQLHLTVLMLKLWSKDLVAVAAKVLQRVRSKLLEALEGRPVAVRLTGLECMVGSPEKAHVLYAKVEEADKENRLAGCCQVIINAFSEAGLVSEKDKKKKLKLHMTLMNTKYRNSTKSGKQFSKQIPFDARQILTKYGSKDWGKHTIVEAHLSQRSAFGEDGYYRCCGSIQFPSFSQDMKDEKRISEDRCCIII